MGGLKALLMLHSPFLHLQAVDELWICLRREGKPRRRDGVWSWAWLRPDNLRDLSQPEKFSGGARKEQGSCQG